MSNENPTTLSPERQAQLAELFNGRERLLTLQALTQITAYVSTGPDAADYANDLQPIHRLTGILLSWEIEDRP
jgi:hypothetical protein